MSQETITIPSPKACWQVADDNGWHNPSATFGEDIALIHSELSEALEAYRGSLPDSAIQHIKNHFPDGEELHDSDKREAYHKFYLNVQKACIAEELADVIIRVLHLAGKLDIDLEQAVSQKHETNKTRPYRHGGKRL